MIARVTLCICCLAAIGAAAGLIFFRFSTPLYEAKGLALVDPAGPDYQRAAASLLKSPAVFHEAYQSVAESDAQLVKQNHLAEASLEESARVTPTSGGVLELRVSSPSGEFSAKLVDAWLASYHNVADKTNAGLDQSRVRAKVQTMHEAKLRLDAIEKRIADLERATGIPDIPAAVAAAAAYQANLLQQQDQDQTALETTKRQAQQEKRELAKMPRTTVSAVTQTVNPALKTKRDELASLESERVRLLAIWLPTSSEITKIDTQIKLVEADIAKFSQPLTVDHSETAPNPQRRELEQSYYTHQAQIAGYQGSLAEVARAMAKQKAQTQGLPQAQLEMAKLARDQGMAESVYKSLRAEYDGLLNGTAAPALPALNPMNPAEAIQAPVFPLWRVCLAWGAGIGAGLGLLLGLIIRPRREEEYVAERRPVGPELPVLVTAPPLPARRGEGLETLALPSTNPAEAYRFMVFSLQARENSTKTILFTGVSNDPLCAEASAQFAVAMSQTGIRTLLIDCNLRDPSLTKAFGFLGKSGITDILSRTMLPGAGNDLILETGHEDLYFLPAGTLESEGIGGFQNLQVQGMLHDVMERADIKIVNAPACGLVSDASRLARHVDQICLVANRHDQAKGLVAKAEGILKLAGAREIEVVLIDEKRSRDSFLA